MSDSDKPQNANVKIDKRDETTRDLDLPEDQAKGIKGTIAGMSGPSPRGPT